MKSVPSSCEETTDDSNIKFVENRKTLVFSNPNRLKCRRITVDGCVIKSGPKCDNLLVTPSGDEHYVELKGTDVERAIHQLETTIAYLHDNDAPIAAYVVCKSQPPASRTNVQRAKKRFFTRWRASLEISENRKVVNL